MDLGIKDRVALVAASSKGLGKESARSLARERCKVVVCARDGAAVKQTAEEIRSEAGADVLDVVADLTKADDIKNLVERTAERFGTVDILVNNCGGPPAGTFADHDLEAWRGAIENNLVSAIALTREIVPFMTKQKWGRIINITSISVKQPVANLILSNSVRAAVVGWAKTLSQELGPQNILVNSICQGYFLTDRLAELAAVKAENTGTTVDGVFAEWSSTVPLGRIGNPEEFGDLVAFLASERAAYITGTTITIDGGLCKGLL